MKERLLIFWAVSATLVALLSVGAVGYLYGKNADQIVTSQKDRLTLGASPGVSGGVSTPRSESEGGVAAVPRYTIPDALAQLPGEWFAPESATAEGYAILFNPVSREIIVERCEHQGYALDESGQPLPLTGAQCSTALSGMFDTLEGHAAQVITRSGEKVALAININRSVAPMELELAFGDHRMKLEPGSKNDLMQTFEARPEVRAQRREYLIASASGGREDGRRTASE